MPWPFWPTRTVARGEGVKALKEETVRFLNEHSTHPCSEALERYGTAGEGDDRVFWQRRTRFFASGGKLD